MGSPPVLVGFVLGPGSCGELLGPVADKEPEARGAITQIHQQVADCCTVHGPSGFAVTPRMCTQRLPISMTNRQYRRCSDAAWACRSCRHVVSERRSGAGGIFRALRTRRIVDALTRWPSLSSSPWILLYPQP